MNVIGNKLSIPVVTYGPGDPHAAHTTDEKISIDEYLRGIEVLKRTIPVSYTHLTLPTNREV